MRRRPECLFILSGNFDQLLLFDAFYRTADCVAAEHVEVLELLTHELWREVKQKASVKTMAN